MLCAGHHYHKCCGCQPTDHTPAQTLEQATREQVQVHDTARKLHLCNIHAESASCLLELVGEVQGLDLTALSSQPSPSRNNDPLPPTQACLGKVGPKKGNALAIQQCPRWNPIQQLTPGAYLMWSHLGLAEGFEDSALLALPAHFGGAS
jgi:hypothetical protein